MPKIDKSRIQDLVGLHQSGVSVKEILESNPDVKKSSLYYHIKKSKNQEAPQEPQEPVVQTQEQEPVVQTQEQVQESRPKPVVIEKKAPVIDSFLADFRPDAFKKESGPSKRRLLDDFFSDHQKATSTQKLDYSPEFLSRPADPSKKTESTIKGKTIDGHGQSWWTSVSKKKAPVKTPEEQQDEKQMETVQKIRLYLTHFPDLQKLHIVPRKKNSVDPDTEKWLISLYTKKQAELDKMLNFIKFHVRNNINEQTSIKMANNLLETGTKTLEHILMLIGLKVQGLSKNMMEDEDVERCVREILIDNSISTLNLGPKADLGLKLVMKVVSTDGANRLGEEVDRQARLKHIKEISTTPGKEKYNDL